MTYARNRRPIVYDSMDTMMPCASFAELVGRISKELNGWCEPVSGENVHIKYVGYDERIEENTHIVTVDGYGVWGYTDGPA